MGIQLSYLEENVVGKEEWLVNMGPELPTFKPSCYSLF